MTEPTFKVIALNGEFFAVNIGYTGQETKASERERARAFKAAVAAGHVVTDRVVDNSGEDRPFVRTLKPEDAKRFGLTQENAKRLAWKLSRAKVRNSTRRRLPA